MTKNKIFSLLLIFILMANVVSAQETIHTSKEGIAASIPSDWTVEVDTRGLAILALSQPSGPVDNFRENCNILSEQLPAPVDLATYYAASLTGMKQALKNFSIIQQSDISWQGAAAKMLHYQHSMDPYKLDVLAAAAVKGNKGFFITCTGTRESFSSWQAKFDRIIKSISLAAK